MAELIRQAIDQMVGSGVYPDLQERRERARNLSGQFHSGIHNLSENHDQHLSEAFKS